MAESRTSIDLSTFPDLQIRKSIGTPKASPTTSTSTRFYSLIERNKKKKKLRKKLDPVFDSEEFKLLCKLYLPKRYQSVTDSGVLMKQLSGNLPVLLPSDNSSFSYPKLNFELHLFLANIVAGYVSSWYGKLKSDNTDFISTIYNVLCEFIRGLAGRFSVILNRDNLLNRIDDLSGVLDDHLAELVGEKDLKIIEQRQPGHVLTTFDREEIIQDYVASKHIIFDANERSAYFRVLVKRILLVTLDEGSGGSGKNEGNEGNEGTGENGENRQTDANDANANDASANENGVGPLNTTIGLTFVDSIVADLVLEKIMDKLGDSQFILSIIMRVSMKIRSSLDKRSEIKVQQQKSKPIRDRIRSMVSKSYKDLSYIMIMREDETDTSDVLDNRVFSLIDRIFAFSKRKPLIVSIFATIKDIVSGHKMLVSKLNRVCKKAVIKSSLSIVNDESLANIISSLRYSIFKREEDGESGPPPILTIDDVATEIYEIYDHKSVSSIFKVLKLQGESKQDTIESIKSTLSVFESSGLNQWLLIKMIEILVAELYPELVLK